jgi:hypothetical protein
VRPEAQGPAEVVSITTRRIEITVEREWSQAIVPAQEQAEPVATKDNATDVEGAPDRATGRLR